MTGPVPDPVPARLVTALAGFAARPAVLVAVDFDGTLAPLVADPATSRPLPAARDALHALAAVDGVRVALVSGRTLADLRRLGDPPPAAALVGSHGAELELPAAAGAPSGLVEPAELPGQARLVLAEVVDQVQAIGAAHPGTSVEVKPSAAVLHTRGADRAIAAAATAQALAGPAALAGVHAMHGKEVVEFAVTDAGKGTALLRLRGLLGLPAAGGVLYMGDDVTDERAFAVLDDDAGDVTVKVGDGPTAARHRVPTPEAVAGVLGALLTELTEASRAPRPPSA